jgi:hypothetical protein
MPASRRTSASSHDEELAGHLQGLSLIGERSNRASPAPGPVSASILVRGNSRYGDDQGARYASTYNAGMMLDEQLDQEMHSSRAPCFYFATSDHILDRCHEEPPNLRRRQVSQLVSQQGMSSSSTHYVSINNNDCQVTTSSAALDLAHVSQTSPRSHLRVLESREKSSEWPQFTGISRGPDGLASRADRRTVTNPNLTLSASPDDRPIPASTTPLLQQHSQGHNHGQGVSSRRGSPLNFDNLAVTTRSVPATPLTGVPGNASHLKTPATPHTPDTHALSSRVSSQSSHQLNDTTVNAAELQASLSRISPSQYDSSSMAYNLDEVYFIFIHDCAPVLMR